MIEIRPAGENEVAEQREIWKAGFGDPPAYIDLFYTHRYKKEETLLLLKDKAIAAMLTLWPVILVTPGGEYPSTMLYAIVRHPQYRHQQLAVKLLHYAHHYLYRKGIRYTLLVPATRQLFNYYRRQGYRDAFFIREANLSRRHILNFPKRQAVDIFPALPGEYNRRRENLLTGKPHLSYRDEDILYQKKLSRHFNADIYGIEIGEDCGCAAVEESNNGVVVKELLLPDNLIPAAMRNIAQLLPADQYIIRTPVFTGQTLGGSVSPFGMIRESGMARGNGEIDRVLKPDLLGYLGLAFD